MSSGFDFMDERSHHGANGVSAAESLNREHLRSILADEDEKTHVTRVRRTGR